MHHQEDCSREAHYVPAEFACPEHFDQAGRPLSMCEMFEMGAVNLIEDADVESAITRFLAAREKMLNSGVDCLPLYVQALQAFYVEFVQDIETPDLATLNEVFCQFRGALVRQHGML
jgi:hypothetical protein